MFYEHRAYQLRDAQTADELAGLLTEHTWTLCAAFRLGELVFVNDASCEDGAQEYAVLRAGRQIESLTCSWATREQLRSVIDELAAGGGLDLGPARLDTNHPAPSAANPRGVCRYCA